MIALELYGITIMATSHSFFALWGIVLYSIGFNGVLGLQTLPAGALAIGITGVCIPLAALFVR